MRWFLSLLLWACLALPCRGQEYEWHYFRDDPTEAALLRGGRQVGCYSLTEDYFRPYDPITGRWGSRAPSPVPVPRRNFGLVQEKIRDGEHYAINGRESSRQEVQQLLTRGTLGGPKPDDPAPTIPDNSSKLRITVIGADAERAPVLADFQNHPALAAWRSRAVVEGFEPRAWQVARAGFVCSGRPTVYVQDASGKVLHRQDDYQGGASALAAALTAAERRADPNYQPQKDPDSRKGLAGLLPRLPWSIPVVAALAFVILVLFRRKS